MKHYATSRKVADSILNEIIWVFNLPNLSSFTMGMGLIKPLTEMSIRNLPRRKMQFARKADNHNAVCESTV
jgi:hypothetical protein